MLPRFAVIGNPIAHSLSPSIHQHFGSLAGLPLSYEKMLGDLILFEQQVLDFFSSGGKGLNVTAPFKQRAFAMAEVLSLAAKQAGAANTLWVDPAGRLNADNTDGRGLVQDLMRYVVIDKTTNILILGTGGAARGIIMPLVELQPRSVSVAYRSGESKVAFEQDFPQLSYLSLSHLEGGFDVIINTIPTACTPALLISNKPFCYDLNYDLKKPTPFISYVDALGCPCADGWGMLVAQAALSFNIWHGNVLLKEGSDLCSRSDGILIS